MADEPRLDQSTTPAEPAKRIGVFVCHCGGNISDYVDVAKVAAEVAGEEGVVVSKNHMFTCSDAAQQEIIEDIRSQGLEALVIASCSPKLHQLTFRTMAERAGMNPYEYVQVNLREQCSWAHTDDREGATTKGTSLVKAGVAKASLSRPLQPLRVDTVPRVLVIGAGVAGLRAAVALADLGLEVHIAERTEQPGGAVRRWAALAPAGRAGADIVAEILARVESHPGITLHLGAELAAKAGSIGDFHVRLDAEDGSETKLHVGAIVVATGFDHYAPRPGEFGYGMEGVVTLPEFHDGVDLDGDVLTFRGRPIGSVAFIYCVGSRQAESETCPEPNAWCSRYCAAGTRWPSTTSTATCALTATARCSTSGPAAAARSSSASPTTPRPRSRRRGAPSSCGCATSSPEARSWRSPPTWSCWSPAWCPGRTRASSRC